MDALVTNMQDRMGVIASKDSKKRRPTRAEAEAAVRTLIGWAGDDPDREGLLDTPSRVVRAYEEFFSGYSEDPVEILGRTFDEVEGYDDMVVIRDITFVSHCEHHIVPIIGRAHIGYIPVGRVVGLSKLARVVDIFGRRLQTQEKMTAQVANVIEETLAPAGVAVLLEATHHCMTTRGVQKAETLTFTSRFTGRFDDDPRLEQRFMTLVQGNGGR